MNVMKKKKEQKLVPQHKRSFWGNLCYYKEYYLMLIPGILFFLVFCYGPMYGLVIAFQDYYPLKGVTGSKMVGLKHFRALFTDPFFLSVLKNTIVISFYKLLVCFPAPILLCLALNEISNYRFKKIAQSVSYLPHFYLRPEVRSISYCRIWAWNRFFSLRSLNIFGGYWFFLIYGNPLAGDRSCTWLQLLL